MEILNFIFGNIWHFLGFLLILIATLHFVTNTINMFLRYFTLRRHGYPPTHCNVDGDLAFTEETSKDEKLD